MHKWLKESEEAMCKLTNKETDPEENVEHISLPSVKVDIQE